MMLCRNFYLQLVLWVGVVCLVIVILGVCINGLPNKERFLGRPSTSAKAQNEAGAVIKPLPRKIRDKCEGESQSNEIDPANQFPLYKKGLTIHDNVAQIREIRGRQLTEIERLQSLEFLAGDRKIDGLSDGSMHWLADELLTVLRRQEPPQENLAQSLAEIARNQQTDPIVRDYIMQHLGHLWEQYGSEESIESALWSGANTSDETTPGSSLIALRNGYSRDNRVDDLLRVYDKAFSLAEDSYSCLATRVTALSIAGESKRDDVKVLASDLVKDSNTPMMLKNVAKHILTASN